MEAEPGRPHPGQTPTRPVTGRSTRTPRQLQTAARRAARRYARARARRGTARDGDTTGDSRGRSKKRPGTRDRPWPTAHCARGAARERRTRQWTSRDEGNEATAPHSGSLAQRHTQGYMGSSHDTAHNDHATRQNARQVALMTLCIRTIKNTYAPSLPSRVFCTIPISLPGCASQLWAHTNALQSPDQPSYRQAQVSTFSRPGPVCAHHKDRSVLPLDLAPRAQCRSLPAHTVLLAQMQQTQ